MYDEKIIFIGSHCSELAKWKTIHQYHWALVPTAKSSDYRQPIGEVLYNKTAKRAAIVIRSRHGANAYRTAAVRDEFDARAYLVRELSAISANPEWVHGFDDFHQPRGRADDLTATTTRPHTYTLEWMARFAIRINAFERDFAEPVRLATSARSPFIPGRKANVALHDLRWAATELKGHYASGFITKGGWAGQRLNELYGWAVTLDMTYQNGKLDKLMWNGDLDTHRKLLAVKAMFNAAAVT